MPASQATSTAEPRASPWPAAAAPTTASTTRSGLEAGGPPGGGSAGGKGQPGPGGQAGAPLPGPSRLQQGDRVVSDDCSQRCTCARAGLLLCEPLGCRPGEVCALGNLTRGCFRGEPDGPRRSAALIPCGGGAGGSPWTRSKPALPVLSLGRPHLITVRTLLPFHLPLSLSLSLSVSLGRDTVETLPSLTLGSLLRTSVSRPPLVLTQHLG